MHLSTRQCRDTANELQRFFGATDELLGHVGQVARCTRPPTESTDWAVQEKDIVAQSRTLWQSRDQHVKSRNDVEERRGTLHEYDSQEHKALHS